MRKAVFSTLIVGALIGFNAGSASATGVAPSPPTVQLSGGQEVTETFAAGFTYEFTFAATAGQYFDIALGGTTADWTIYGYINNSYAGTYQVPASLNYSYELPTTGDYEVFVTAATDPVGAFELSDSPVTLSATPVPAAFPLFAAGFGVIGILGWRRNSKVTVRSLTAV